MMYKGFFVSAGLLVLAACSNASTTEVSPFSARIGVNSLINSEAKDLTKDKGLTLGLGYALAQKGFLSLLSKPSLDLDWSSNNGKGNKLSIFTLSYTERVPFSVGDAKTGKSSIVPYVGLGAGISYTDLDASVTTNPGGSGAVVTSVGSKKLGFAGRALLGVMFEERFSLEAGYRYNGSNDGVKTDSFSLTLGVKF